MTASKCSPIVFRQPEPGECTLLWQIALDAKRYWGYGEEFMESCREELKVTPEKLQSHEFQYRLLEWDGTVCGFYCLERLNPQELEVEAFFVSPDHIGKGLGAKLWAEMVENVKSIGGKTLVIASDPFAENFYKRMGVLKIGEVASGSIPGRYLPLMQYDIPTKLVALVTN